MVFRDYIENELFVAFSDGRLDRLATSKNIWVMLEFTPKCIKEVYELETSK